MSPLDHALTRFERLLLLGPGHRPAEPAPVPDQPGRRRRHSGLWPLAGVGAAVLLPLALGAALIPVREELSQSISLLMVLPVLVIALLANVRLSTVAALVAAAAFDLFHTRPYYQPVIDDADDVVETVVLLAIGVSSGYLARSAQRSVVAARVRHHELVAVTDFLHGVATSVGGDDLVEQAGDSIRRLLSAKACTWKPDYRGTASPVLRPDGTLTIASVGDDTGDGGILPATIEIPVGRPPAELGRFIVRTNRRTSVSLEERRAAATVASALARCLRAGAQRSSRPAVDEPVSEPEGG